MKILEVRVLRGPNYWSIRRQRLIQMKLDLEELEYRPTDSIPGFKERIQQLLPSLYEHQCSEGVPGGFFTRVERGTWMGHVIEHIALEIQKLAGMETGFGRTRGAGLEGVYYVVFAYAEEEAGKYAASAAVQIADALIKGTAYDLQKDITELKRLYIKQKLGPSTGSIVQEAQNRNIPYLRLDDDTLVQLGYGAKQKRINATIACSTSQIAVEIAGDKAATKRILTAANIPVPGGEVIYTVENLKEAIDFMGFPVVLKPLNGNHGKGATINITSWEQAQIAFERAKKISDKIIVERFIQGQDYRVLVIDYKFVAAALRTPAMVTGDGTHTVRELIDLANKDPRRGDGHDNMLTFISVDDVCIELLAKKRYDLDTIIPEGEELYLKPTANLSTGGTATDVTDDVHPANISLFERIARTIGLDICGIDVMAPDLTAPLRDNGGAVLEVNAAPGFRMHLEPTHGKPRNVARHVVDMLFNSNGRIPIITITGTNGKTTTTRMVAHMVRESGYVTGYTTTDGVYIGKEQVMTGDCAGPQSAQLILRDPAVEFAVLETARGGILRSGLGFDQCDTAIITNIAEDHLGLDGIDTLEKLASVKAVLAESVRPSGFAVLNADDDLVYAMKDKLSCKIALFSMFSDSARIEAHCNSGGLAAVYENGYLLLRVGNHILPIEEVQNVPVTFNGKAEFNIANALAACLAAYVNKIKLSTIRKALRSFIPSNETTPGRVNIFEFPDFNVILDYAHNPHGVRALGKFIRSFDAGTKVGVITGVGDRRDEDIIAIAEEAAKIFDEIIIRHDDDLRGRTHEEMDRLLTEGIRKVDATKPLTYCWCECEAVDQAILNARPGSLIVVLIDNIKKVAECIRRHQELRMTQLKKAV